MTAGSTNGDSAFSNHSLFELLNLGSNSLITGRTSHPSAMRNDSAKSRAAFLLNLKPST